MDGKWYYFRSSNRGRMPASERYNDTVGFDSLPLIYLRREMGSTILHAGGGVAITADATWHLTVSRQNRSLPWPLNLYF
jgi:hypothetical protein